MTGTTSPAGEAALEVEIAPMVREDLDGVLAIERASYRSPWAADVFLGEQHRGWARLDVLRQRPGGEVRGYVNHWLVGDEVHVLNLAVHPDFRRRGLGGLLLDHVAAFALAHRCRYITLEVRRSNRGALMLYRRHHFRPVAVRPRYYEDGEDAIVMLRAVVVTSADGAARPG
jgi:ribosomal-protein-alanine N-acetyltransferase